LNSAGSNENVSLFESGEATIASFTVAGVASAKPFEVA